MKPIHFLIIILLFSSLAGCAWPSSTPQSEAFDPVAYVDGIWDSRIIPTFDEEAVELRKILSEIMPDADGIVPKDELIPVAEKYGRITLGDSHVYMVKGSGRVLSVDTENIRGTAEVALDGYEGPIQVLLYIGPRISTYEHSVREAVGFIKFQYFVGATDASRVTREINRRIVTTVLSGIDRENLSPATLTRALLEGMVEELWQFHESASDECRARHRRVVASGNGVRRNPLLAGIIARRAGLPVYLPRHTEEASFGAALAAGVGIGAFPDFDAACRCVQYVGAIA